MYIYIYVLLLAIKLSREPTDTKQGRRQVNQLSEPMHVSTQRYVCTNGVKREQSICNLVSSWLSHTNGASAV